MNELVFYLSPILGLLIIGGVGIFLRARSANVKVSGLDYLWLNNLQRRWRIKAQRLRLPERLNSLQLISLVVLEKFVRKIKIEALRAQVWSDRTLDWIKLERNDRTDTTSNGSETSSANPLK